MTSKTISLIVVSILIILGAVTFRLTGDNSNKSSSEITNNSASEINEKNTNVSNSDVKSFTLAEIAVHNTSKDCWTIINDKVYDITSYIPRHPGGDDILLACGNDGSSLFTQRLSNEGEEIGSGSPHSSSASNQLASLQIGILVK